MTKDCGYSHCLPSSGSRQLEHKPRGRRVFRLIRNESERPRRGCESFWNWEWAVLMGSRQSQRWHRASMRCHSLSSVEQWRTLNTASVAVAEWQYQRLLLRYDKEQSCPWAPVLAVGENGGLSKDCWVSLAAKGGRARLQYQLRNLPSSSCEVWILASVVWQEPI